MKRRYTRSEVTEIIRTGTRAEWDVDEDLTEGEERRLFSSIADVQVDEKMTPMQAFHVIAHRPIRINAGRALGLAVNPFNEEVAAAIWDEFRQKTVVELVAYCQVMRRAADGLIRAIDAMTENAEWIIDRCRGEAEKESLMEWWNHGLDDVDSPKTAPSAWRKIPASNRRILITLRAEAVRNDQAVDAVLFRLMICEAVSARMAISGTVETWEDTPEDERPVLVEPEHPNQEKPYKEEMILEVRRIYLENGQKRIKAACRQAIENLGVGKESTVYSWVQHEWPTWGTERDERA